MLTIQGKALGRKKPLFADWSIPVPPDVGDGGLTLRNLIGRVVRAEVEAFKKRQQERQLFRADGETNPRWRGQGQDRIGRQRSEPESRCRGSRGHGAGSVRGWVVSRGRR